MMYSEGMSLVEHMFSKLYTLLGICVHDVEEDAVNVEEDSLIMVSVGTGAKNESPNSGNFTPAV